MTTLCAVCRKVLPEPSEANAPLLAERRFYKCGELDDIELAHRACAVQDESDRPGVVWDYDGVEAKADPYVEDNDTRTSGTFKCQRCAGTGQFVTGTVNGQPAGPGGICYRCGGSGTHNLRDRKRNAYYDSHAPVRV